MADICPLSRPGEARLRLAFSFLRSWTSEGLLARLQEPDIGAPSVNAAYVLISRGLSAGLLERTGERGNLYALKKDWEHPCGRAPLKVQVERPQRRGHASAFALVASMIALHPGPLVPSLGLRDVQGVDADGELLPCVGGAIAAGLHRQFVAVFVAGE